MNKQQFFTFIEILTLTLIISAQFIPPASAELPLFVSGENNITKWIIEVDQKEGLFFIDPIESHQIGDFFIISGATTAPANATIIIRIDAPEMHNQRNCSGTFIGTVGQAIISPSSPRVRNRLHCQNF
jgi:hypothetical protein